MHLLSDYTRLFVTIENTNENTAIDLVTYDLVAIQGKKQFGHIYNIDSRYRMIKHRIPPGIEETGVLLFEPLNTTWDDVRFVLPFRDNALKTEQFIFDVKLSE